jgi:uncharacterized protein involved in exopolysaccharide biosynthesis
MPTKTASPKNTAAGPNITEDRAAVLHWRDHPLLVAAEQHLQRGQEALAAAEAQVTALEAEVERARVRLHEALVAQQIGDATEADVAAARAALAETEARLAQAREVADVSRGALAILERRRDEAMQQAREEVAATLEAQRKAIAERLGAVLAEAAAINRTLLAVEDLLRQNSLPVPEPLAWGELLPLTEPKVLRNKTLVFDYAVGAERCLLGLWLERARRAGYAVPDVEPVPLAEAVPSRFGRP